MMTIRDVAREAGVSIATVSRVMNRTKPVDPMTRSKVEKAVLKLGYKANEAAQRLRGRLSGSIGVLTPTANDAFFSAFLEGIHDLVEKAGYSMTVDFSSQSPLREFYHGTTNRRDSDGFIVHSILPDHVLVEMLDILARPAVLFQRSLVHPQVSCVFSDDYAGFAELTQHLLERGHRRIAVVRGGGFPSHISLLRDIAFRDLTEAQGVFDPSLVVTCDYDSTLAYSCTRALLQLENRPTAIMYWSDHNAIAGCAAVHDLGLRVPADCAITGFNGLEAAQLNRPSLTTVRQDLKALGEACVNQLVSLLNGGPPDKLPPVPVNLHVGQST